MSEHVTKQVDGKPFGKVAVGIRCGDRGCDPVTLKCWTRLIAAELREGDKVIPPAVELPHHWAANLLAHLFLTETDCDTLLMIDDDMTWQPGTLAAMRDNRDNWTCGIVQGLCCSRKSGHGPLLLAENGAYYSPIMPEAGDGTLEVGMVGLAFTLIRRSAFKAVEAQRRPGCMFFAWGSGGTGEDAWFCKLARKGGVRIGVDTTATIGHRVPIAVHWDLEKQSPGYHTYRNQPFLDLLGAVQNEQDAKQED